MAVATSTIVALALAAAAAGTSYYNTTETQKKQDNQAAEGIRQQSKKQQAADQKVNSEVDALAGSNSSEAKAQALQGYMDTLAAGRKKIDSGLNPTIGGAAFAADSANAKQSVADRAATTAGLMSRIDAPGMQRQQEGFGYGNLATDLGLIKRQASGDDYLNQLKLGSIHRSAGLDFASALLGAAGGAAGAGAGGALGGGATSVSQTSVPDYNIGTVNEAVPYMAMRQPQYYGGR